MKLDIISVVIIVFCFGVCASLFSATLFEPEKVETVIADSQ